MNELLTLVEETAVWAVNSFVNESIDCTLEGILWGILNNQNYQIQLMYGVLKDGLSEQSRDNIWSFDGLIPVPGPVGPSFGRPTALP